jgi:hypothetical protein
MGCECDWGHVQGWIESEDRRLGRVLRLHGRAVRSEKKAVSRASLISLWQGRWPVVSTKDGGRSHC